jgi:Cu/Ag efflux protein CusF
MIARLYRPLVMGLLPIALIACMNSPRASVQSTAVVPLGIDLGGSGPVTVSPSPQPAAYAIHAGGAGASSQHGGAIQMAHAGANDAHGTGTVNSVDPAQHKVNLTHNPIPEIGWPSMTMEFPVTPSVDLKALKPGSHVNFTIEPQPGGMYQIQAISPMGGQ